MKYFLVFEKTGDTIPFDPVNQELLDFYIDQLDKQNLNAFYPMNRQLSKVMWSSLESLNNNLQRINSWLFDLFDKRLDSYEDFMQYLDQRVLNKLHADWVQSQNWPYDIQAKRQQFNFSGVAEQLHDMYPDDIQFPMLSSVIQKLERTTAYGAVNLQVHHIEYLFESIRFTVSDSFPLLCDNPFPKSCLTNDLANLSLSFNHLGRTLYEKWLVFDRDLEFDDENSYNELLGFVTLYLRPHESRPLNPEYVRWCQSRNKVPIGDNLNIGIIPDLQLNQTKYRRVILQNLSQHNKFTITHT